MEKVTNTKELIKYMIAMFIYGTVAIFSHYINLPSGLIVLSRGVIGIIVLLLFTLIMKRQKINFKSIRKNLVWLIFGGLSLGLNWIFLFSAYTYTSVAFATLMNYLAPAIMILLSPLVFKEKLTIKRLICAFIALFGMVFISGIFKGNNYYSLTGFLFGIGSATFYVTLIICNKKLKDINAYDKTIVELFFAIVVMIPYSYFTSDFSSIDIDLKMVILILIIGIVHTGIAYILYFGPMEFLSSQTISIFSYIEPATSIVLSILILKEELTIYSIIGTILILGATFISEISFKQRKETK